ncbi:MAG: HAMP domain-containing protein [bacterium]|nr:HAMP domain-containing protein [bacterium]
MSLRSKIVLVLVAVVVLFVGIDNGLQRWLVRGRYLDLERKQAMSDLARITAQFGHAGQELANQAERLVLLPSGKTRLDPEILQAARIDLAYVCETDGRVIDSWNVPSPTGGELRLPQFPRGALSMGHPLVECENGERTVGWMTTENGLMLVAGTTSKKAPELRLIVGCFVDGGAVRDLGHVAHVDFDVHLLAGPIDDVVQERLDVVTSLGGPAHELADGERVRGWKALNNLRGVPVVLLEAVSSGAIAAHGAQTANYAMLSSLGSSVLILTVLLVLLRTIVTGPLHRLTRHAVAIGQTDDLSTRFDAHRNDEIGVLAGEFDSMMAKLADSREELMRASRLAGKSEVSTEVLHNVGNVLNSVQISWQQSVEAIHAASLEDLRRLAEDLRTRGEAAITYLSTDSRIERMIDLMEAIHTSAGEDHDRAVSELRRLGDGIHRIGELVQSQGRHAQSVDVVEWVDLPKELDEVLSASGLDMNASDGLLVLRDYADVSRTRLDRHRLFGVLVPVVHNAIQAMEKTGAHRGTLLVRLRAENGAAVAIDIVDDGVGIAPQNMTEVFAGGYSTRGALGMGLHLAANTAREMGGNLTAESAGEGKGATFTLHLPGRAQGVRGAA